MNQKHTRANGAQRCGTRYSLGLGFLALALAAGCCGCQRQANVAGDPNKANPGAAVDPVGTYNLETVDGKTVPCKLEHEGHAMTINSGSFVINADGTCSSKITLAGRDTPMEVKATYTQAGPKLTMKWQRAGMTEGTVQGDTFTMNNEGMVFAYRR